MALLIGHSNKAERWIFQSHMIGVSLVNSMPKIKSEGRNTAANVLRYRKKKIVNIFFTKIPSKISLRINWKYLFRDESETDKNICFQ